MNSTGYLYAAYIATWSIQGLYLGSVVRRYIRLQRRMKNSGNNVGR